jgi:hypothetical protein
VSLPLRRRPSQGRRPKGSLRAVRIAAHILRNAVFAYSPPRLAQTGTSLRCSPYWAAEGLADNSDSIESLVRAKIAPIPKRHTYSARVGKGGIEKVARLFPLCYLSQLTGVLVPGREFAFSSWSRPVLANSSGCIRCFSSPDTIDNLNREVLSAGPWRCGPLATSRPSPPRGSTSAWRWRRLTVVCQGCGAAGQPGGSSRRHSPRHAPCSVFRHRLPSGAPQGPAR